MRWFIVLMTFWVACVCGSVFAQAPGGPGGAPAATPQWRPVYHFTPAKNWTNDPNGPLWLHGEWLVYNQQNPFGIRWGHMSWGHAVSSDLVHWRHLPVAIPEVVSGGDTTWIFSGSAVWDEHNTSGFCRNGGCIVAIYTAHQPNLHKESQYIAYSNDGGLTFTNYSGNPVIDLNKRDFRDPNVFWYSGTGGLGAAGSEADGSGTSGSGASGSGADGSRAAVSGTDGSRVDDSGTVGSEAVGSGAAVSGSEGSGAGASGSGGSGTEGSAAGVSGIGGSGQWLMAVSMTSEHQIRLYGSANLRDWKVLSDFGPAGYTGSGWECPSLIELPVEGSPGVTKWVMMNSAGGGKRGVFMQYWVGDFDGVTFHNDNPADTILPVDYGDCFYAAIPWNNAPLGAKILVGWMIPGPQATYPWTGQFSIPRDLSLRRTASGYRLIQEPASVVLKTFDRLPASSRRVVGSLALGDAPVRLDGLRGLNGNTWMMDATLSVSAGVVAGFKIGEGSDGTGTVIGFDGSSLFVDRSRSGAVKIRPGAERWMVDVGAARGSDEASRGPAEAGAGDASRGASAPGGDGAGGGRQIRLRILMDKGSLEIFVNGGEKVLTTYVYPEPGATGCSAFATGGEAGLENLKTWDLSKL
jgi:sucrose-6-phosphate hydrolase SacC (GH32 family)